MIDFIVFKEYLVVEKGFTYKGLACMWDYKVSEKEGCMENWSIIGV